MAQRVSETAEVILTRSRRTGADEETCDGYLFGDTTAGPFGARGTAASS